MSHFSRVKTKLVKKEHLVQALRDLNYQPIEGNVEIRGFSGQRTAVEVMIHTKNPGYDLGFRKVGDTYELVADWYGIHDINQKTFLNQVQQKYAYRAVMSRMKEQGFEAVEEKNTQDNTIHITLRRTVF